MRAVAALAPVLIGVVAAIAVTAAGGVGAFRFEFPLATVLVLAGILASVLVGILVWALPAARNRHRREYQRGREEGAHAERGAHRRFLARLDHELKNPITAIRTALAAELDGPASPNLVVAAGQAERLATVVGELRSLSSLETRALDRESVDVGAILSEESEAVGEELSARGTPREIAVDLPTAPWPLPPIAGDPDLIAVAVRNLLVNAAKYSDEGARIEVRGAEDDGFVVVDVADTGWGIAAEELSQVWDELWRSDRARGVEGSGLGLSLVRIVAERHGGEVSIRSHPGRGTSVRMRLPIDG